MTENYVHIQELANDDVTTLRTKGLTYGSSWRNRGGVGAFMMLARKWDRIENIVKADGYDVFTSVSANKGDILDDIRDLRRYLLLVESYITQSTCSVGAAQARGGTSEAGLSPGRAHDGHD